MNNSAPKKSQNKTKAPHPENLLQPTYQCGLMVHLTRSLVAGLTNVVARWTPLISLAA